MKVKNIVFSGAMASILMIGVATAEMDLTLGQVVENAKFEVTATQPDANEYTFLARDGTETSDPTKTKADDYVASSTAAGKEGIAESPEQLAYNSILSIDDYAYTRYDADGTGTKTSGSMGVDHLYAGVEIEGEYFTGGTVSVSSEGGSVDESFINNFSASEGVYTIASNGKGGYDLLKNYEIVTEYQDDAEEAIHKGLISEYESAVKKITEKEDALKELYSKSSANYNALQEAFKQDQEIVNNLKKYEETWAVANEKYGTDGQLFIAQTATYNSSLSKVIDDKDAAVKAYVDEADVALSKKIAEEATTRDAKDAELSKKIAEEATTRDAKDAELDSKISEEVTTRAEEDEKIRADFAKADLALSEEIAKEAATREAADAKLQSAIDENRNNIAALDSKINDLDENLSAGIASSVALSSVAVANVQKGEMSIGGGYGNYNSKSAMAFGAALGITDNWSANAGVGFGFGKDTKASFRVGTNYKFKLF